MPVTGRPAGWCDHIARMWPVDAVVGENGAFYFCYARRAACSGAFSKTKRARAKRARLAGDRREHSCRACPGCALASDQPYRETDLAIDYCEDVAPLPLAAAERIVALMREAGLTAKVSSIHVNGWFGNYDKLAMTKRLFAERYGMDLAEIQSGNRVRRRFAERRADVRLFPQFGGRGQRAEIRQRARREAALRDHGSGGRGLQRVGSASSCSEIATLLSRADYHKVRAD